MHPAFSVIFFTVVSGSGYGLLFLLGVALIAWPTRLSLIEIIGVLVLGMFAAAIGLFSSMLHLGQPQRAWRALSQWRSSWLSREGVAAVASFVPACALATAVWLHADATLVRALAGALALLAALTVYCTAQIYASLKTIRAWHNAYVVPGYLLLGLLGGSSWFYAWHGELDDGCPDIMLGPCGLDWLVIGLCIIGALFKLAYWRHIDAQPLPASTESATGLGRYGTVRSVEAPHSEENYLTREMGFALARKHAARLRRIALTLLAPLPVALIVIAMLAHTHFECAAFGAASAITLGLFVERWLFFAEAKHVVMLYYAPRSGRA